MNSEKEEDTYDGDNLLHRFVGSIPGSTFSQSDNPVCRLVCMLYSTPSYGHDKQFNL